MMNKNHKISIIKHIILLIFAILIVSTGIFKDNFVFAATNSVIYDGNDYVKLEYYITKGNEISATDLNNEISFNEKLVIHMMVTKKSLTDLNNIDTTNSKGSFELDGKTYYLNTGIKSSDFIEFKSNPFTINNVNSTNKINLNTTIYALNPANYKLIDGKIGEMTVKIKDVSFPSDSQYFNDTGGSNVFKKEYIGKGFNITSYITNEYNDIPLSEIDHNSSYKFKIKIENTGCKIDCFTNNIGSSPIKATLTNGSQTKQINIIDTNIEGIAFGKSRIFESSIFGITSQNGDYIISLVLSDNNKLLGDNGEISFGTVNKIKVVDTVAPATIPVVTTSPVTATLFGSSPTVTPTTPSITPVMTSSSSSTDIYNDNPTTQPSSQGDTGFSGPVQAGLEGIKTQLPEEVLKVEGVKSIVMLWINYFLGFYFIGALVLLLYNGAMVFFDQAGGEKRKQAVKSIVYLAIGTAIILFAYAIVYTIINLRTPEEMRTPPTPTVYEFHEGNLNNYFI